MSTLIQNSENVNDFIKSGILQRRYLTGQNTHYAQTKIVATKDEWGEFVNKHYHREGYRIIQHGEYCENYILDTANDNFISFHKNRSNIEVNFFGGSAFIKQCKEFIEKSFEQVSSSVRWVYNLQGYSISNPLDTTTMPVDSMYPNVPDGLNAYYEAFLKSTANILLLIGPPGTGKTTFLKGLIHHAKTSATVCYDPAILAQDSIFASWMDAGASDIMVLEDSDTFLSSREDGNSMMTKFLNVGDGLVSVKGKKLIFSTNLPNINDVDEALLRPGRCFDVLRFELLNLDQARRVANDFRIPLANAKKFYTIADIFHKEHVGKEIKFGFI